MTLYTEVQIHRNYEVNLNYFVAYDTYDEDDILKKIVTNTSKEKMSRGLIRMIKYFIYLLNINLKE